MRAALWIAGLFVTLAGLASAGCSNEAASCSPACRGTQTCCASGCSDTLVDPNNCGGCGMVCAAGQTCAIGHCTGSATMDMGTPSMDAGRDAPAAGNCHPSCASGSMCCGTTCVSSVGIATGDARTDPSFVNCRVCGSACDAMTASRCGLPAGSSSGSPSCLCGNLPACRAGETCELAGGSFSCINHTTDPRHCGDAGVSCATGEMCMDGMCTCLAADGGTGGTCPTGLTCTTAGCIDTQTDEMNCGSPGNACRAGETCTAGACACGTTGTRCPMGGLGMCGQRCCNDQCVYVDDYNCAGCGMACSGAGTDVCVHGIFGGMPHCGAETGMMVACDAPLDAPPSFTDVGTDDAGIDDAGTDDASVDAYVDPG